MWDMGKTMMVSMDDRGRILIPKAIRERIGTRVFFIELKDDGTIVLKPIVEDVLRLAGKFKDTIKYGDFEELERKQEEYIKKERGI